MYKRYPYGDEIITPPDETVLWRYMDFCKFIDIIERNALFFARADKFEDPYEGVFPKGNVLALEQIVRSQTQDPRVLKDINKIYPQAKEYADYILCNCWHENTDESEAMWKIYSKNEDSIVIKTNVKSLKNSLLGTEDVYIGRINYINYDGLQPVFKENICTYMQYLHKRKSFEHEREVRAIIDQDSLMESHGGKDSFNSIKLDRSTGKWTHKEICKIGLHYKVDVSTLIREVIVSPYSNQEFTDRVKLVCDRYGLKFPVGRSTLLDPPEWYSS